MTEKEQFMLKCQEHFTLPCWDTKKAFLALTEDSDLLDFTIREMGMREDYFSDEQEKDLMDFMERMLNSYFMPYREIRLHRVDPTILTLRLLLSLADDIYEYRYYKGLTTDFEKTMPNDPSFGCDLYGDKKV